MFTRHPLNPLIIPQQVKPSRADFEVVGAFNAGVIAFGDEVLLLLRVSERPTNRVANRILSPHLDAKGVLSVRELARDDPDYDTSDPRKVQHRKSGEMFLTSISHLRLARSQDGLYFTIEDAPWLMPETPDEAFGTEDARITRIEDTYWVNYTAVSPRGVATALASTGDFVTAQRHGIIFPPANRDVVIFPERVGGQYICYHRPMPGMFGTYNIWMAASPDLIHWGEHRLIISASAEGWENGRVGGGAPPLWTERGWLSIYHAADRADRYCLGAFLTPHDDPAHIIARSAAPIFVPEAPYETAGFFPNVVFTCGAVLQDNLLSVYYGAADDSMALAQARIEDVLNALQPIR